MNIHSYAKLNFGLKVERKRDDGFHDILSIFHEVDLYDDLIVTSRPDGAIEVVCESPGVPEGFGNLAYRAATVLRDSVNRQDLGATIEIRKRIPAGGGLGGGSGNAAGTLIALNRLWDLGVARTTLEEMGARIGSDVPFSIRGGASVVTGRGEYLQAIDSTGDLTLVLVDPGFSVSTPWAFGKLNIKLTSQGPYTRFLNSVRAAGEVDLLDLMLVVENDFLPVIQARFPSVQRILSVLRSSGAIGASMSGTGATLYGGFASEEGAQAAVARLRHQGYASLSCKPLRRRPEQ